MSKFRLLDFQVVNLNLESASFNKKATETLHATKFDVSTLSSDEPPQKGFGIKYNMTLANKSKDFKLTIEATAHFECDFEVDQEFLNSDFARINAPAIGFPYLRAFISNFTLSAGFNPIFLPTYNFVAMGEAKKKKEISEAKKRLN